MHKKRTIMLVGLLVALTVAAGLVAFQSEPVRASSNQQEQSTVETPPSAPKQQVPIQTAPASPDSAAVSKQEKIDAANKKRGLPAGCSEVTEETENVACITQRGSTLSPSSVDPVDNRYPVISYVPDICRATKIFDLWWITRTQGCSRNKIEYTITNIKTKIIVGGAELDGFQWADLQADRLEWKHKAVFAYYNSWGAAKGTTAFTTSYPKNATYRDDGKLQFTPLTEGGIYMIAGTLTVNPALKTYVNGSNRTQFALVPPPTARANTSWTYLNTPNARCDRIIINAPGGCVYEGSVPYHNINLSDPTVKQQSAHIWDAQKALRDHWGWEGHGPALSRTTNRKEINKNRDTSCPRNKKRPKGMQCDEYPFASTQQGAGFVGKSRVSTRLIAASHNTKAGIELNRFYNKWRVLHGDKFWVWVYAS